jgi:hypothetical protein
MMRRVNELNYKQLTVSVVTATYRFCLLVLRNSLVRSVCELGAWAKFRDNKVAARSKVIKKNVRPIPQKNQVNIQETEVDLLVCIKPLGHLHSRDSGISPGH